MVKRKYIAVAVLLFCCASLAQGQQCTGQYANDPIFTVLTPKQAGAVGYVTATITEQATNVTGAVTSHHLTVTPGTVVTFNRTSYNATSARLDVYTNGSFDYSSNVGVNSTDTWTIYPSMIGNTYALLFNTTGANGTSVDRVYLTVVAGNSPSSNGDGLDTNFYQQVTTAFGGNSMLTSCQECLGTGSGTQHCINAVHTPYSTISLTNDYSGESQLIQGMQAGNAARSNESVNGNLSWAVSVLPGDTGTISIDDKIICSMDGVIFEQTLPKPKTSPTGGSWNPSVTGELAFTKVALKVPTHCTPLLDSNGNVIGLHCDVAYYCSARSSPPDYQPTGLDTYHYTNPALVPPFWMSMAPGTALVFGKGTPSEIAVWYFPFATLHGVLTGVSGTDPLLLDILSPAWVSDSSTQDCTKWISGISPWYMPKW